MTRAGVVLVALSLLAACGGGDDGGAEPEALPEQVCGIPTQGEVFDTLFPDGEEISYRDGTDEWDYLDGTFSCRVNEEANQGESLIYVRLTNMTQITSDDVAERSWFYMEGAEEVDIGDETPGFSIAGEAGSPDAQWRLLRHLPCRPRGRNEAAALGVLYEGPYDPEVADGEVMPELLEVSDRVLEFVNEDYGCDPAASDR